ncbi:MAG: cupin domain-containing protein [Armatimonadota bacterium]
MIEKYLADINEMEETETEWGSIGWLVSGEMAEDATLTMGVMTLNPGERGGEHFHPSEEEVFLVLEGECDHTLGEEVAHLTPGMMIRCPVDVPHYAVNTGDVPMRALVVFPTPSRTTTPVE